MPSDGKSLGGGPIGSPAERVEVGPPCDTCGTPMERQADAYTGADKGWKCREVFYDDYTGAWEHG